MPEPNLDSFFPPGSTRNTSQPPDWLWPEDPEYRSGGPQTEQQRLFLASLFFFTSLFIILYSVFQISLVPWLSRRRFKTLGKQLAKDQSSIKGWSCRDHRQRDPDERIVYQSRTEKELVKERILLGPPRSSSSPNSSSSVSLTPSSLESLTDNGQRKNDTTISGKITSFLVRMARCLFPCLVGKSWSDPWNGVPAFKLPEVTTMSEAFLFLESDNFLILQASIDHLNDITFYLPHFIKSTRARSLFGIFVLTMFSVTYPIIYNIPLTWWWYCSWIFYTSACIVTGIGSLDTFALNVNMQELEFTLNQLNIQSIIMSSPDSSESPSSTSPEDTSVPPVRTVSPSEPSSPVLQHAPTSSPASSAPSSPTQRPISPPPPLTPLTQPLRPHNPNASLPQHLHYEIDTSSGHVVITVYAKEIDMGIPPLDAQYYQIVMPPPAYQESL